MKLEKKEYKAAYEIVKRHLPQYIDKVGSIYALYLMTTKSFNLAVEVLKDIECNFYDIVVRLME